MSNRPATTSNVYKLLGNRRRLLTVKYLSLFDQENMIDVRQIASAIRSIETDTPPRAIPTDDYKSAYNSLIQQHLPKLDEAGLIEYDDDRKTVMINESLDRYSLLISMGDIMIK
ncbi:DUF7344 domain-containing protein [Halostagnicola kamekurae]|uniref:DUF7344 domain-containing protein n=1 Tax=Halostagnicola kamekurae TaxID=619731 RepID=A0A1I6V5J4_9EURY|nr:hypothetical protein [Halostagnicola kamekurae]SFT09028.1 hypothetical protein SAMN04488556_0072 [Halostagnicola kamekurae]